MMRQFAIVAALVLTLLAALFYSQRREEPVVVSGFVEADEIRVGSRLGGRILELLVEEGQEVEAGQALVRFDPFTLEEQIAQAEAQLAAAQADLERLRSGFRHQEIAQAEAQVAALQARLDKLIAGPLPEEIAVAEAQLQLAEAQLKRASSAFRRVQLLIERGEGTISQDEIDRVTEEFQAAQALVATRREQLQLLQRGSREEDIRAARAELEAARAQLALLKDGYRPEDVAKAEATVAAAEAALQALRKQQTELTVVAPSPGTIAALDLRPGDLVAPGAPVLSLQEHGRLWVRAYIPERYMRLQLGDALPITADSYPGKVFTGKVVFIAPQAEFTPRNIQTPEQRTKLVFRIKIDLLPDGMALRPGLPVDVWLSAGPQQDESDE
ncbi:MAG: secretion protein HlyD [Pirellulaceae bacterium]|nr:MAG: secretion protein HlyD [Pirellulaceae bacterium]